MKRRPLEIDSAGSTAVRALERAWEGLRGLHAEIPEAVLVLVHARGRLGHFAESSWRVLKNEVHEVALSPALLSRPEALLETLVHEASHAALWPKDDGGVRQGYYHLKEFRDKARHFGLRCEFRNTRYGWTDTSWPEAGVPAVYTPVLRTLTNDLSGVARGGVSERRVVAKKLPKRGMTRAQCGCEPPRSVYMPKSVLVGRPIVCTVCGKRFARADVTGDKEGAGQYCSRCEREIQGLGHLGLRGTYCSRRCLSEATKLHFMASGVRDGAAPALWEGSLVHVDSHVTRHKFATVSSSEKLAFRWFKKRVAEGGFSRGCGCGPGRHTVNAVKRRRAGAM